MQSKKRRIRSFENLENRLTFAGDVTTDLTAGVLTITGDAAANGFTLDSTGAGEFTLTGITHGGSATKIDGVDNDDVDFTGVTSIIINTDAGADSIQIQLPFAYTGTMTIDSGIGNDVLTIGNSATLSTMTGDLIIAMGDGDDTVDLQKFTLDGPLSIDTGADNDTVKLGDSATARQTTVTGTTTINGGAGNDNIALAFATLGDDLAIGGDADNDTITFGTTAHAATINAKATITTAAGADTVRFVNSTMAGNLIVDTGDGDDVVDFQKFDLTGQLNIAAGADNDTVTLGNVASALETTVTGTTTINGNAGNDTITLPFVTLDDDVAIAGDAGNDIITFGSSIQVATINAKATITTAAGTDQVRLFNVVMDGSLLIDTGSEDDTVALGTLTNLANINGEITISTGAGVDAIRFNQSTTIGKMTLDAGDGDDTIAFGTATTAVSHTGNLVIRGGIGEDKINLQFFSQSSGANEKMEIFGGDGNDTITLGSTARRSSVDGPLFIRGELGNDTISMPYFNHSGDTIINTGDGTDTVTLGTKDGAASYLSGTLSIRTETGAKTITETNVNIIGNQDFGAALTNNDGTASNAQNVTISTSTFGSFLYFNFGGRLASLKMDNTNQTGSLYVYNRSDAAPAVNGDDRTIVPVNQNFTFNYANSAMGGNLILDATTRGLLSINNAIILGGAQLKSVGTTNSFSVTNSSMNLVQFISRDSYTTSDAVFPTIKTEHIVDSASDNVQMNNVIVNGTTSLESAGSITLTGVRSGLTVLSARNNSTAFIRANASQFTDLILQLGSTAHPNETGANSSNSTENDVTNAEITNSIVTGTLTFDSTSRVKSIQFVTSQGITEQGTAINRARANYSVIGSQVGTLFMPAVNDQADKVVPDAEPGVNFIALTNSTLQNVNVSLPKSNDAVSINGTVITVSAYINGGGGNNLFNRNNSTINGLSKVNFAN